MHFASLANDPLRRRVMVETLARVAGTPAGSPAGTPAGGIPWIERVEKWGMRTQRAALVPRPRPGMDIEWTRESVEPEWLGTLLRTHGPSLAGRVVRDGSERPTVVLVGSAAHDASKFTVVADFVGTLARFLRAFGYPRQRRVSTSVVDGALDVDLERAVARLASLATRNTSAFPDASASVRQRTRVVWFLPTAVHPFLVRASEVASSGGVLYYVNGFTPSRVALFAELGCAVARLLRVPVADFAASFSEHAEFLHRPGDLRHLGPVGAEVGARLLLRELLRLHAHGWLALDAAT